VAVRQDRASRRAALAGVAGAAAQEENGMSVANDSLYPRVVKRPWMDEQHYLCHCYLLCAEAAVKAQMELLGEEIAAKRERQENWDSLYGRWDKAWRQKKRLTQQRATLNQSRPTRALVTRAKAWRAKGFRGLHRLPAHQQSTSTEALWD